MVKEKQVSPNPTDPFLLDVSGWGVDFRDGRNWQPCIRHVGFKLRRGGALGIVGASGTGKSVTVQSLIGMYDPVLTRIHPGAEVRIMGENPLAHSRAYRHYRRRLRPLLRGRIGMVFQEHRALLNPLKTIAQHFKDAARLADMRLTREAVLDATTTAGCFLSGATNLDDWLKKYPHELSGGEAQRIQIAFSLLSPKLELLICDEITSNLDAHHQWRIVRLLRKLHLERGIGLIFISHDWAQVEAVCDQILVLDRKEGAGSPHIMLPNNGLPPTDDRVIDALLPIDNPAPSVAENRDEIIIQAQNLYKRFGSREIIHNLNITIRKGESYALIGESGSGKSTVARMILGVEKMQGAEGDLKVFGRSRREWTEYDPRIQMVFQNFAQAFNPYMTSGKHLQNLLDVCPRADGALAASWVRDLGLEECLSRGPSQMSGGEKQRLGLVEAFALKPGLILADEPTAGLDKAKQAFFLEMLAAYRAEQDEPVTEFLITHDLRLVSGHAERIGVLYAGSLLQEITTDRLGERVCLHPYTELLFYARDLEVDDVPPLEPEPEGCPYYLNCHRRDRVKCDYRAVRPPITRDEYGWSACPYSV